MRISKWVAWVLICVVFALFGCVPQKAQLKGTWEFVGYKNGRVKSIIETDSTVCFDGDGNGYYYLNDNPSLLQRFTYLFSDDHKLVITMNGETSAVEYSVDSKEKRLTLEGIEYRFVSSEAEPPAVPLTSTSQYVSTPTPLQSMEPTLSTTLVPTTAPTPMFSFFDVDVGDEIQFGQYEQDNNAFNGPEPIIWIVLEKQNGKILVLSKYALDSKAYHEYEGDRPNISWEHCSLRNWLNDQFYSIAFNSDEKDVILRAVVSADRTPQYNDINPGNDVLDNVFLLSASEANRFFTTNAAKLCWPTKYALANGADTKDTPGTCWWWLRSPGKSQTSAAIVSKRDGAITTNYIGIDNVGVRPSIWIQALG